MSRFAALAAQTGPEDGICGVAAAEAALKDPELPHESPDQTSENSAPLQVSPDR